MLLAPFKLKMPPARLTAGRLPTEPRRSATYVVAPLMALSSMLNVAPRLTVMVFEEVILGRMRPCCAVPVA